MQRGVVTPHSKSCPLYSNFQEVYCIRVFFLLIKLLTEISIIVIWWTERDENCKTSAQCLYGWYVNEHEYVWCLIQKVYTNWCIIFLSHNAEMLHHHYRATKHRFIYVLDCLLNYFNLRPKLWYYAIKFLLN